MIYELDVTPKITVSLCMALLGIFALLAWGGIRGKNATYDEVLHTPASWINTRYLDFRINPEDPPLWKYWAALPLLTAPPQVNKDSSSWLTMLQDPRQQWRWSVETLYRTPGNDPDALVNKSRIMMLTAGLALGAVLGWWGWHLGGGVAAVVTTLLFTFDPNFLAHAPLVKNDVALTLVLVALVFALWRLGLRVTWPRAAMVAAERQVAVVPPRPAFRRLLEEAKGIDQTDLEQLPEVRAFLGCAMDLTGPGNGVVDIAVFGCDVVVAQQHQVRVA